MLPEGSIGTSSQLQQPQGQPQDVPGRNRVPLPGIPEVLPPTERSRVWFFPEVNEAIDRELGLEAFTAEALRNSATVIEQSIERSIVRQHQAVREADAEDGPLAELPASWQSQGGWIVVDSDLVYYGLGDNSATAGRGYSVDVRPAKPLS